MIKTFLYSMFAVFLFALGAAGSWFYLQMEGDDDDETKPAEQQAAVEPTPAGVDSLLADGRSGKEADLPVPVPSKPLSAEEVFRFGAMNRDRHEQLRKREDRLKKEETRLKLAHKDIEARQREIEGVLAQVNDTLSAGEKLLNEIKQASEQLEKEKQDVEKKLESLQQSEQENNVGEQVSLKIAANWLQGMKAEDAAETIRELINEGNMDFALIVLANIEQRNVAKILEAMKDPVLVAELTERFPKVQRPVKKKR